MNVKGGECQDCGHYWSVAAGGINEDGQCPICEDKFPVVNSTRADRHASIYDELARDGVGLGCC